MCFRAAELACCGHVGSRGWAVRTEALQLQLALCVLQLPNCYRGACGCCCSSVFGATIVPVARSVHMVLVRLGCAALKCCINAFLDAHIKC